ncbi:MAG: PKD domain-containing protein [Bacteroidia bacterium]|nr:PKD domain-containing protein [Bacteroidia bacterium]
MKLTRKLPIVVSALLLFVLLIPFQSLQAQIPSCATDEATDILIKQNPAFQKKQKKADTDTYEQMKLKWPSLRNRAKSNACGNDNEEVYTIPVVVHVMHLPSDSIAGMGSNLSDAIIQAGIDHLNEAFRDQGDFAGGPFHSNASSFGIQSSDVKIEFTLAKRDPNGNSTDGINRISTDYSNLAYAADGPTGFSSQDAYIKSLSYWNSSDYANVWLVNEICKYEPDSICGVAGYAYLAGAHGASYDGIVNEARYWGSSYHASKVHIHEFGHYLNLYHTFNDPDGGGSKSPCENGDCLNDGDYVCDTPPDNSSSAVNCNSNGTANSCTTDTDDSSSNNPFTTDVDDMYENYMDYGYQSCQNTFTPGQKERMRLALTTTRSSLLTSTGAIPVSSVDAEIADIISPGSSSGCESFTPAVSLKNQGSSSITSAQLAVFLDDVYDHSFTWNGSISAGATETINLSSLTAGVGSHNIKIYLQNVNGVSGDGYAQNDTSSICFEIYTPGSSFPYCQDFESISEAPANWSEENISGSNLWSTFTAGTGCSADLGSTAYYLDNWNSYYPGTGTSLDLFLNSMDLSNLQDAKLYYTRSYKASYSNRQLSMEIAISTDCGQSYSTIQSLNNSQLATSSGFEYFLGWEPTACDDWTTDSLDLSAYVGGNVMIRFRANIQAYYAQNLYLDNVCVKGTATASCNGLELSIGSTDETCNNANGSATVQVADGTAPYTYNWNSQPAQTGATATALAAGNYQVIVEDNIGCKDTAQVVISNTGSLPTAGFNFFSSDLDMTISNTSSSSTNMSFSWHFGDGNSSTDTNPNHTYAGPGTYTVCLLATNDCGTDTLCRDITLNCPKPDAGYTYSANELQVSFQEGSIRSTSFSWDFGDGNTSTDADPNHSYALPGTYTVCLVAISICGTDTFCQDITVSCPGPEADFSYQATNLEVSFSDLSVEAESISWHFGDGSTSTLTNPVHRYDSVGSYEVCLIVSNLCGNDTICQTVEVDCPLPTAAFGYDASQLNVIFLNQSSFSTSYIWDFGDGNTSNLPRPFHSFELPGTYNVCQTVFNDCGQDSICQTVVVSCPGPQAAFSYDLNGLSLTLFNNSSSNAEYNWDFGDGNTSKDFEPLHTFDSIGIYMVSLETSTICGADTSSLEIEVSSATSISPEQLLGVSVYPNPSQGIFFLEIEEVKADRLEIQVNDIRGRVVLDKAVDSFSSKTKEQIDLSGNPEGIYFLNVQAGKKRFVQKISLRK